MKELIEQWKAMCRSLRDYTCNVDATIRKGSSRQERQYRLWYRAPSHLRAEVLRSNALGESGAVIVYSGGAEVRARAGGLLSLMSMSFPVNSPRVTSVRGNPITHMSFPHLLEVLERYERAQASIELGPSETIDGQPTTVLVFTTDDASVVRSNDSIVRDVVWLDASSLVPLRIERYENRQHAPVVQLTYLNIKLNVGLTDKVFDLHSNPR